MITKRGSVVSQVASIANSHAEKNYVFIKNIFEKPIEENFKVFIVNYRTKKLKNNLK